MIRYDLSDPKQLQALLDWLKDRKQVKIKLTVSGTVKRAEAD